MQHDVFVEPVRVEVGLDRRLRCGDALIAESRDAVRDGEIVIAESDSGPCVGRYLTGEDEIVLYPLTSTAVPTRVRREELRVRGVVIGVKSSL
jgi:SOS-response transcriptional repressor LexA